MINTLSVSHQLFNAGIRPEQAVAIADVIIDSVAQKNENPATRESVYGACKVVRSRINAWHGHMCAQKTWIVCWIVGMGIAVTGALFTGGLFF